MAKSNLLTPTSPTSSTKPKTYQQITSAYASRFGKNDDQINVTEEERRARQKTAAKGADQYYDLATSAYIQGWSSHFHYTPFAPDSTINESMHFYAHRLAHLLQLQPHMKVLDVGCGVGGPAREIAKFIGCEIIGITINQYQVDRAIEFTARAGLSNKCTFIRGDFLKLHEYLADASFDAAYAIEATPHAPSLREAYANIARVLKPGAPCMVGEWVLLPLFNPDNQQHIGICNRIERGNGLSNVHTSQECHEAFVAAGFEIFFEQDIGPCWDHLSLPNTHHQDPSTSYSPIKIPRPPSTHLPTLAPPPLRRLQPITPPTVRPWFYPLQGQYHLASCVEDKALIRRLSPRYRWWSYRALVLLEKLRLAPKGVREGMDTMAYCVDSVLEGGMEGVFTPCWWIMGTKIKGKGRGAGDDGNGAGQGQTKMEGNEEGGVGRRELSVRDRLEAK